MISLHASSVVLIADLGSGVDAYKTFSADQPYLNTASAFSAGVPLVHSVLGQVTGASSSWRMERVELAWSLKEMNLYVWDSELKKMVPELKLPSKYISSLALTARVTELPNTIATARGEIFINIEDLPSVVPILARRRLVCVLLNG